MSKLTWSSVMTRWWSVACVPALLLVLAAAGCSDTNPMIKLRRAGAVIEQDDDREKIERVVLSRSASSAELDGQLVDLARIPRVLGLDLSGTQVTDEQLKHLAGLDEVQTLDLSDTAITSEGLPALAALTSLQKLTLSNTLVTNEGLVRHIPSFPALEILELSRSKKPERESVSNDGQGILETIFSGIKLGIDLAGGANLILEVDERALAEQDKELTPDVMAQMATAINKRANPGGNKELTVRPLGTNRIEVIIPKADPQVVEQTKRMMTRLGSLELAILANTRDVKFRSLVQKARDLPGDKSQIISIVVAEDGTSKSRLEGAWLQIDPDEDVNSSYDVLIEPRQNLQGQQVDHVLVSYEAPDLRVNGSHLSRVYQARDDNGRPAVGFTFNMRGSVLFADLTGSNEPDKAEGFYRRLAIILDGNVFSAPTLESRISDSGIIRGDFTRQEINELIGVLKAGALEVPLKPEPISEMTISPTLGGDVQKKGVVAILIASITVVVFMIGFYRFSGMVAVVCLIMNLLLVMGTMIFIAATFTLPGLAGLVLTIGMAVDANVLIFERIREEQRRGGVVRLAIQNGFSRAFTTIVDANVTTLLVAVVLYMIGTDQVRGFAVTLFIGIVMSMFTALFVGRLMFDIWERSKRRDQLKMNSLPGIVGRDFDFLGRRRIAAMVSLVVIAGGMFALVSRGANNFDIDFRGGRAVSFELLRAPDGATTEMIRSKLLAVPDAKTLSDSMSLEELTGIEDDDEALTAVSRRRFRLRTTTTDTVAAATKAAARAANEAKAAAAKTLADVQTKAKDAKTDDEKKKMADVVKKASEAMTVAVLADADAQKKADAAKQAGGSSQGDTVNKAIQKWIATAFAGDDEYELATMSVAPETVTEIDDPADADYHQGHRVVVSFSGGEQIAVQRENVQAYVAEALAGEDGDPNQSELEFKIAADGADPAAGTSMKWVVQFKKSVTKAEIETALAGMVSSIDGQPRFDEVTSFDASVANEMQQDAALAMLFSLVAIVGYIWFRFQRIDFGLAAVVALVHDVLVVLGGVALAGLAASKMGMDGGLLMLQDFKINLPMVAAFLTIVGYSLNDTIVVFDRIREVRGKNPSLTTEMVNLSLNQTLSRTLLTSLTTFIVVVILYFGGGDGIHGFAYCLVLGVVVGTYSSIFVASPTLLWMMNPDSAFNRLVGSVSGTSKAPSRQSTAPQS